MVVIREAAEHERETIRERRAAAYREYAVDLPGDHWSGLERSLSSNADEGPGVQLLVADIDGEIAGSVAVFPPRADAYAGQVPELDYPEIRMLAVSAPYRGQGIAAALLGACIERAKQDGFRAIGLHTGSFMKNAIRLYEKFGFERIPQYDFMPAGDGIVVMAFRLSFE